MKLPEASYSAIRLLVTVVLLVLHCLQCTANNEAGHDKPSIAIIGAGIGGTSAAYFLRQKFGNEIFIDIFEDKEVGGRLATVNIGGRSYESGGSIIHPENFYMVNFTKMFALAPVTGGGGRLALFDGEEIYFKGSEWDVKLMLQLVWRYGWDPVRINEYVKNLLSQFENIYIEQENGHAFSSVDKLVAAMSPELADKLYYSCEEDLHNYGMSEKFINELVQAALLTNYGQTNKLQAFVGSVSLAGIQPGLWKVHGGNKQVPEKLFEASNANLISAEVINITKLIASSGKLQYQIDCSKETCASKKYDVIVIAAPLTNDMSNIQFINFSKPIEIKGKYHRTVATFVQGWPNISNFGYESFNDFPTEILATTNTSFFNSIGRLRPIDFEPDFEQANTAPVWKVFSQIPLTESNLNNIFASYSEKKVVDWLAYPQYESKSSDMPNFKLNDRLYYINTIEWAASAMEMSVIGARNAVLLAYNEWYNLTDKINPKAKYSENVKNEL